MLLDSTAKVFKYVNAMRTGKSKVRRLDVTSTLVFLCDIERNPLTKLDDSSLRQLAQRIAESEDVQKPVGKSTSGATLARYYEWWRENIGQSIGIHLDARRFFDEGQKEEIRRRDNGMCGVCGKIVLDEEAEYDHFPTRHRDGGQTEVANGRLVHKSCHERGRPEASNQRRQRTAEAAR